MDKTQTQIALNIMQAFVDGKEIEVKGSDGWLPVTDPTWDFINYNYRVKPEKKIIDLSVAIESGIDCEFSQTKKNWESIFPLKAIVAAQVFKYVPTYQLGGDL